MIKIRAKIMIIDSRCESAAQQVLSNPGAKKFPSDPKAIMMVVACTVSTKSSSRQPNVIMFLGAIKA